MPVYRPSASSPFCCIWCSVPRLGMPRFGSSRYNTDRSAEVLAETGTIQFVRTVMVKPTISGEVRHIHADVGDRVSAGDVLAVIEPDPSQSLQLSRQRARVDGARIDLSERELNFERKRALHERSLISAEEFDQARIAHTRARHDLDMAELELRILELKVNVEVDSNQTHDAVRVLSPLDGIVIARAVEGGEVVASGTSSYTGGTEMFRIGDPDRMIVKSAVGEIDAGRVRPGQDVRIRVDAYPDAKYHGQGGARRARRCAQSRQHAGHVRYRNRDIGSIHGVAAGHVLRYRHRVGARTTTRCWCPLLPSWKVVDYGGALNRTRTILHCPDRRPASGTRSIVAHRRIPDHRGARNRTWNPPWSRSVSNRPKTWRSCPTLNPARTLHWMPGRFMPH